MKKHILHWSSATFLLITILLLLIPYFSAGFLDLRQQEENEKNYQRILSEQKQAKEDVERAYLTGKFDPAKRLDFIEIPAEHTLTPNKIYLRKETLDDFLKMEHAASQAGITLKIASATRNFDYQKEFWNKQWNKFSTDEYDRFKKIIEYTAIPGTSRHHWGTDIDLNNANLAYFKSTEGKKMYEWMVNNASSFGFCQPYNLKDSNRPTGHNEEKWHWSYLPLAKDFTRKYKNLVKDEDIKEFLGDEFVAKQNLIDDYALGINPECM